MSKYIGAVPVNGKKTSNFDSCILKFVDVLTHELWLPSNLKYFTDFDFY